MRILAAMISLAMISAHVQSADPSSEVKKLLEKLEKSSNAEYRSNICMNLAELGPKASSAIPRLLEIAEQDLNNGTRQWAIIALGEIGDANTAKKIISLSNNQYKNNVELLKIIAFHLDQSNKEYQKYVKVDILEKDEDFASVLFFKDNSPWLIEAVTLINQNKVKLDKRKSDFLMKSIVITLYPPKFLPSTKDLDRKNYTANTDPFIMNYISMKSSVLLPKYLVDFDTDVRNDDKYSAKSMFALAWRSSYFLDVSEDFFNLLCQNITIDELRSIHLNIADKQKSTDFDLNKIVAKRESGKSHEYWIKLLNNGKPNERRTAMKVLIALSETSEDTLLLPDFSKYEHDKDEGIAALAVRGMKATKLKK